MKRLHIFYIAYLALGIIWGTNFLYMKWAARVITPSQIVFLRVLFGFFPVSIWAIYRGQIKRHHLKFWYHFFVMSLLATTIYFYCFAKGTALLNSGIAGALSGSIPIFSTLTAFIFLREEKVNVLKSLGIIVGFLGVVSIAQPWDSGGLGLNIYGILFMILGSLSVGTSFVYAKKFLADKKIPAAALTTYQMFFALLTLGLTTNLKDIGLIQNDIYAASGLFLGLGVIGTGFAYILYYLIVNRLGAVIASSVTYIPPVVALFIGFSIAREAIAITDWIGAIVILSGVYLLRLGSRS